jgi:hypothetical protein
LRTRDDDDDGIGLGVGLQSAIHFFCSERAHGIFCLVPKVLGI